MDYCEIASEQERLMGIIQRLQAIKPPTVQSRAKWDKSHALRFVTTVKVLGILKFILDQGFRPLTLGPDHPILSCPMPCHPVHALPCLATELI